MNERAGLLARWLTRFLDSKRRGRDLLLLRCHGQRGVVKLPAVQILLPTRNGGMNDSGSREVQCFASGV